MKMKFAMVAAVAGMAVWAGVNPQFLKWQKMKSAGLLPQQKAAEAGARGRMSLMSARGAAEDALGLAPDVVDMGYLKDHPGKKNWKPGDGYPRKFDLRESGCATAVGNQGRFNTCWAFATLGSLESAVMVQKPEGESYTAADVNFSERHMVERHGYDLTAQEGGSMLMAMAYLLRWGGPAAEAAAPYPAAGATEWPEEKAADAGERLHVQQVRWLPGRHGPLDNETIKHHLMNFGGVYATLWSENGFWYSAETAAHYCPYVKLMPNHGVTIMGWDDDFPRENFRTTLLGKPVGDGAFLVKNSLGGEWGDGGYFWVSYYDANIAYGHVAVFCGNESRANYTTIWQHDELGYTGKAHAGGSRLGKAWMANVFTAEADDKVAAVGFYALAPDTQYQIRIYTEMKGDDPSTGTPRDANTTTGNADYAGYHTIPLKKMVPVAAGTKFAVCVHLYSKDVAKPLAMETQLKGYSSRAGAERGQSWYSAAGQKWNDLAESEPGANFCVKAYGIGGQDEGEFLEKIKPSHLEVEGPQTLAAGTEGEYATTMVYADNSRFADGLEVKYRFCAGAEAVAEHSKRGNAVKVKIREDLEEDAAVQIMISSEDEVSGIELYKLITVNAVRTAPGQARNVRAGEGTLESGVRVEWDAVAEAEGYTVYRGETDDPRNALFLANSATETFTDLTAAPGLDYWYYVKARNSSGSGALSAGAKGWRKVPAPKNLAATDGDFDYVQLTWEASEGANAYRVYRATRLDGEGNPADAEAVSGWMEGTAWRDTPPEKGTKYFYTVAAALSRTGYREGAQSVFDIGSRAAPVELTAVRIAGPATVAAGSTAEYRLDALLSDGTRMEGVEGAIWSVAGVEGSVTAKTYGFEALADGAKPATNVLKSIRAEWTMETADGAKKAEDVLVVSIAPVTPAAPNAPKVVECTTAGVKVEWEAVEGAGEYRVWRGTGEAEEAELIASTAGLAHDDAKAIPGAAYRYWVEAANAAGVSPRSGASATAMRRFTPPQYVSASNGDSTDKVTVAWRKVTGARRYRVTRADSADGARRDLSGWIEGTKYEDVTAEPGKTYWYFVEAAWDAEGGSGSEPSAPTVGRKSAAQTLAFIEITGPAAVQYNSQGTFTCTATYANGAQKRVKPEWSFKSAHELVTVDAEGVVTAGLVENVDLQLELQAKFTDGGVEKTHSFAVTVLGKKAMEPQVKVSNVVVRARWPWNGVVDITYDLYSAPATTRAVVNVTGYDHDLKRSLQAVAATGDGFDFPAAGGNPHVECRIEWNVGADCTNFHSSAFSVALEAAPYAPAPPAEFRASEGTSTNGVELAWNEAFGAVEYEIYRSAGNVREEAELIATVQGATEYTDAETEAGETYWYWIRTVAGEFESDVSEEAGPAKGSRMQPPYAAAAVNLREGLAAYYPFDGNTDDASGNGLHMAAAEGGAARYVADRAGAEGAAGEFGGGLRLDAAEGTAAMQGSFTFAAWVKTGERGTLRGENRNGFNTGCNFLVHPADGGALGGGYGIAVWANGVNVFERGGGKLPAVLRHAAELGDGWHHVAFTVDANGAPALYVDGAFAKTGTDTGSMKFLPCGKLVGGGEFGGYKGLADDVCYWNRALGAEEVAALYAAGSPLTGGMPVAPKPVVTVEYGAGKATVSMACTEEGAPADDQPTVRYTISRKDGGPAVEDREYTVPFEVSGDATVTAWSVKEGYYNSARVRAEVKAAWKDVAHGALAEGDGEGEITFDTAGDVQWRFDPDHSSDINPGSMRSGRIGPEGSSVLTARVKGKGTLAFDWKVSSEAGFDVLEVAVDGESAHRISGETEWAELAIVLTNDVEHVVTWTYAKDAGVDRGEDCGWVDFVTWTKEGTMVGAPVATVTEVDGGERMRVEMACPNLPGAHVEYRLELFGETGEWTTYEGAFEVEGDGIVSMRAKKAGYADSAVSRAAIRRPWTVRAGEALFADETTKGLVRLHPDYFGYGTEETYWWDQDRGVVSDGGEASMKSPKLADLERASFYGEVSGAGTLYFDRKVDSEAGWDVLTYYAGEDGFDYAYADSISGRRDWERVKLVFRSDSTHVIEWEYDKDDSGKAGQDCSWVDRVQWVPARYAPAAPEARTGYRFEGWAKSEGGEVEYEPGVMLDAEDGTAEFAAVWRPVTYLVRYDATPAEGGTNVQEFTYDEPQRLKGAADFAFPRGYAFRGWDADGDGQADYAGGQEAVNLASEEGAEVRLEAALEPVRYVVRYLNADGTQAAADMEATYGTAFTVAEPAAREGWRFLGWDADGDGVADYAPRSRVENLTAEDGATVTLRATWECVADETALALDCADSGIRFEAGSGWFAQTRTVKVGESAMQSGRIGHNQSSMLAATYVNASGKRVELSFWWKVSSEAGWDCLRFRHNGSLRREISGQGGEWQRVTATLEPGTTNRLEWTYSKDGSVSSGEDCGWVDGVEVREVEPAGTQEVVHVATTGDDATGDGSEAKPYRTIQRGVDRSAYGGIVLVHGGTYAENVVVTKAVNLLAKEGPTRTTIAGSPTDAVVKIEKDSGACKVWGFTVTGGKGNFTGVNTYGGALELLSDTEVRDCIMHGNGNGSTTFAGAVHVCDGARVTMENCLTYDNYAWACGGATLVEGEGVLTVSHCTAAANRGGNPSVSVSNSGTLIVTNSIAWSNPGRQIGAFIGGASTMKVGNSTVQGGQGANGVGNYTDLGGNVTIDPQFYTMQVIEGGVTNRMIPYMSRMRETHGMGFSLEHVKPWTEAVDGGNGN